MRVFVAVSLPDELRGRLGEIQERLRRAQADVSWVKPGNLHITLKFLGEVEPKRLDRIRSALAEVACTVSPFTLSVAGLGTFGGRIPRVVWVGAREGADALTDLAMGVEAALSRVGFPREKRGFTAHFTLGRVRSPRNVDALLAAIRAEEAEGLGSVMVNQCILMQSELHPSGSTYTAVDRFALGTTAKGDGGQG